MRVNVIPTTKSGDDGHLPQGLAHVERSRQVPHHEPAQARAVARRRQHLPTNVSAEVEVGVVDPDRVGDVERHAADLLAVARHQVDALSDRLFDALRAPPAGNLRTALEDVDRAHVERGRGALGVEEPGVTR